MAALVLLIPVVAVTAKIDRSQNKSGYQYDQVNYLKVRHGITPFAFVSIRGKKPRARKFFGRYPAHVFDSFTIEELGYVSGGTIHKFTVVCRAYDLIFMCRICVDMHMPI